jgi:fimbrial chaperone protein
MWPALFNGLGVRFTPSDMPLSVGVLLLLGACAAAPACAGNFAVTPVRIYMEPRERATAVTVTNDGDQDLVMQADIFEWTQTPDGQDVLTLSEDMILSPPILKMAARSRQVVRLIALIGPVTGQQRTYRLIVREIPEAKPDKGDLQLQIAYAFSIPIFITPQGAAAKLDCRMADLALDLPRAACHNTGSAASHPVALHLVNRAMENVASRDSGAYILAGAKHSFDLKRIEGITPIGALQLVVPMSDGTSQRYDAHVGD